MEETIKLWFKEGFTDFDSEEGLNRHEPFELKRVNVLVGANNSGKSRFMREFAAKAHQASMDFQLPSIYLDINDEIDAFFKPYLLNHGLKVSTESILSLNKIKSEWQTLGSALIEVRNQFENAIKFNRYNFKYNSLEHEIYKKENSLYECKNFIEKINKLIEKLENLKDVIDNLKLETLNFYYINSLRSLKNLQSNSNQKDFDRSKLSENDMELLQNPFISRVYQDYKFLPNQIITGEDFFDLLTHSLLGQPNERQRIQDYQEKISHYFFNNLAVTIIPNLKNNHIEIKIGNDDQYPISQLGDGLQQVIILTYKAFLTTESSFLFIEEPEMHLHAGYVKQLVKFLLEETEHYYMMTSHSNYLLDMINEDNRIALYRVDKKQMDDDNNNSQTIIKRCDGDRTILQTLGVSPSSVFLANCTIWVEGITDRLYFVQYLKKYLEELKEQDEEKWNDYSRFIDGYHYTFVEYQGSNLDHWDFLIDSVDDVDSSKNKGLNALLVTSNALVIADADLRKKPRFNDLKKQLSNKIIITQGKETENTLPKSLLIKNFFELCPDNGLANQGNKRKLEYKAAYINYFNIKYEDSSTGIGNYLDKILTKMRKDNILPKLDEGESSFTFADGKQGTIKYKTDFCQDIVTLMQTENWQLADSAKILCEAIFEHIAENNP